MRGGGERMAQDERLTPATNDRNRWLGPPVSPAAGPIAVTTMAGVGEGQAVRLTIDAAPWEYPGR